MKKLQLEAFPIKELKHFARPAEDTPTSIWREAEILRPGTYKGHKFSEDDVVSLTEHFDPRSPVPLQMEHNMSLEKDHGRVHEVAIVPEGSVPVALGLVNILGAWAVERVLDGRLHALSAGLFIDPCWMDELSFVRRGACPTARLLSEETPTMDKDEDKKKDEDAPAPAPAEENPTEDAPPADEAPASGGDAAPPAEDAKSEEDEAKKKDLSADERAELEQLRVQLAEKDAKIDLAECEKLAHRLMLDGYTTPALQGDVEKFLLGLPADNREGFLTLMRQHDRVWQTGRQSKVPLEAPKDAEEAQYERMKTAVAQK